MKISGIIAEYNPFHNGHRYQIEKTRENGATHLAAVMSGNYVQRGDLAVFSKWARAKAAIENGIDLVIELPTPFALSAAPDFSYAGVFLLNQLGVDEISFGSECGSLPALLAGAKAALLAEHSPLFSQYYQSGISYPKALQKTVEALCSEKEAALLAEPNNLLAVEYLKAAQTINPNISFFTVQRNGAQHDSKIQQENTASGSFLRGQLTESKINLLSPYVPASALEIYRQEMITQHAPVKLETIEDILLYHLRNMKPENFSEIQGVCEGMENRLYQVSREALSLSQLTKLLQTKRYTDARIRRILLSCLLGIKKNQFTKQPAYLRVLACNQRGAEILKHAKKTAQIPIVSRFSKQYRSHCSQAILENSATDLYSLASPKRFPCGREFTEPIFFKK